MPSSLEDVDSFNTATQPPSLSVVHFAAEWVDQCSQVNDVLDALAKRDKCQKIRFYKCQAESLSEISFKHQIEAVPTVLLFRSGKVVDRIDGADAAKITDKIEMHCNDGKVEENKESVSLEERLKKLTNKAPVMLFMKGDRETPRCGFSKTMIGILNGIGVEYETFDILSDEEVRQGLKTFSNWPTYPQLYVKGDLIGGLDIVKEMQAAGEFETALKG